MKHTLKNFVNASPVEIVVGEIPNSNLGAFYNFETQQITLNENLTDTKQILSALLKRLHLLNLPTVRNHTAVETKALMQFALHI